MKKIIPSTKAIALTDIEVLFKNKMLFRCRQNDTVAFKDVNFTEEGKCYLILHNNIQLPLTAFKII